MKNIFIACDTNNIKKIKKIIKQKQFRLKEYRIGYKFGLEFLYEKREKIYRRIKNKKFMVRFKDF